MTLYDEAAREINKICTSDCWKNPKTDCPYFDICTDLALIQNPDEYERTRAFEDAMTGRYMKLKAERS